MPRPRFDKLSEGKCARILEAAAKEFAAHGYEASSLDRILEEAGKLSTGNLQRLGLARALLHEPALRILDEPAGGLDPAGVAEIRERLLGLARERGVTSFMSSQTLAEVDRLASINVGLMLVNCPNH